MSYRVRILTFLAVAVCLIPDYGQLQAAAFQIIASETPMISGGGQGIRRYIAYDTFGAILQLPPIPGNLLNDPSSLALRNDTDLFVSNRAAHHVSSIARFSLTGSNFASAGLITDDNHLADAHQLAFDPVSGELFQTNRQAGRLSRFLFDVNGNPVANGYVQMPAGDFILGVTIRPADRQLFVSNYDHIWRFTRNPDGSYTYVGTFNVQSGELYHYMKVHNDELYLAAFQTDRVLRFSFDAQGNPVLKHAIAATGALDVAFSPDGQEMFVTNHRNGGITRYRYNTENDTWTPFGDVIPTPSLGGIVITPIVCSLQADLTGDCIVNLQDLHAFISQWLQSVDPYYCTLSANMAGPDSECKVNIEDFSIFASQWMETSGG